LAFALVGMVKKFSAISLAAPFQKQWQPAGTSRRGLLAVVADGLDRATFDGFHALGRAFVVLRLFLDERIAALVVAREKCRSGFAAQVAVDALLVNVKFASDVCFPFVCFVCHKNVAGKQNKLFTLSSRAFAAPPRFFLDTRLCLPAQTAHSGWLREPAPHAMFSERRYDRFNNDYDRRPTSALVWLLCALVAGFVIQMVFEKLIPVAASFPVDAAAFSSGSLRGLRLWTLATYILLHGGPLHLIVNAVVIYFMGREVLPLLGNKHFVLVTLASAIGGALLWFAVNFNASPETPLIGASAIAVALLVLFACFYPDNPITVLLFFIIPVSIRPKTLAIIVIALDVFGLVFFEIPQRLEGGMSIAHSAHLGGVLVALGYYFLVHRREWRNPDGVASSLLPGWLRGWLRRAKKPASIASPKYKVNITSAATVGAGARTSTGVSGSSRASSAATGAAPSPEKIRAEVDRILDKINSQGFASLTDDERHTLDSAKDLLNKR